MAILQFLHFFLDMHINYEEFIFFQNSMLKGKWGWAPSRGFPFSMGNMIRPLHSKLSMVDMSSALSSKSNTFAFSSIREGVTDLGITTVIRKIKKYIDVYFRKTSISFKSPNMLLFLKMAFFRKCYSFFKSPNLQNENIPKNYPELEI